MITDPGGWNLLSIFHTNLAHLLITTVLQLLSNMLVRHDATLAFHDNIGESFNTTKTDHVYIILCLDIVDI